MKLVLEHLEFHPAVELSSLRLVVVRRQGSAFTISDGLDAPRIDAFLCEEILDGLGAFLGKGSIVLPVAVIIRVSGDLHFNLRVLAKHRLKFVQLTV